MHLMIFFSDTKMYISSARVALGFAQSWICGTVPGLDPLGLTTV